MDKVKIKGYKSLRDIALNIGDVNLLIGANGAGKSNFLSFFELLGIVYERRLAAYVTMSGGVDKLLYHGRKETAKIVISASSNSVKSFKKYMNIESPLLNESECLIDEISVSKPIDKKTFDFLWVGKMDFRKQLGLALRAVAAVYKHDIRLHIVGGGDNTKYRTMAQSLGIMDLCVWHGAVSHEEVLRIMQQSDLFFFTSVAEGTPHVVLEAIANHLPILCFNTCGQGDAVNETVGRKIPLSNPNQSVKDFAKKIEYLYSHRDVLKSMSDSCKERSVELSWDNKARQMTGIYEKAISNRSL